MCTFAAAKVVIALAECHQYTEKEQFMSPKCLQKGGVGCFSFLCVYRCLKGKMTLKKEN